MQRIIKSDTAVWSVAENSKNANKTHENAKKPLAKNIDSY